MPVSIGAVDPFLPDIVPAESATAGVSILVVSGGRLELPPEHDAAPMAIANANNDVLIVVFIYRLRFKYNSLKYCKLITNFNFSAKCVFSAN